jgi:imidazoleglycerol phosphate synthase glutamine amidotransferase subunit HisH
MITSNTLIQIPPKQCIPKKQIIFRKKLDNQLYVYLMHKYKSIRDNKTIWSTIQFIINWIAVINKFKSFIMGSNTTKINN